jgi:sugar fermentation stimulation protein A
MEENRLYEKWEEARFVDRPNRFTLVLRKGKRLIMAYLPNTGRIEEYLIEGNVFFITPSHTQKFNYRIVSTIYQNSFVLLDTMKMNSLVGKLLTRRVFPSLGNLIGIQREISSGSICGSKCPSIRVDFMFETDIGGRGLLEVKTCTFCHNGVALFPDAPSVRALHHLDELSALKNQGFDTVMLFLIPHRSARRFMPNFHTDYDFSMRLLSEKGMRFIAANIDLIDPVSVNFASVREIPIDYGNARIHCTPSGSYVLVLKNPDPIRLNVGKLGTLFFREGYYAYVGSALRTLDSRVRRHSRRRKRRFWHVDYITPYPMEPVKTFLFRRADRIEGALSQKLEQICTHSVDGFGASDAGECSHLFFFPDPPHRSRSFIDVIMDFKTFTE